MTTEELIREWKHTLTQIANEMEAPGVGCGCPHSCRLSDVLVAAARIRKAIDALR